MSFSVLMWHLSSSGHLGLELMMKSLWWFLKLAFWAIFIFTVITTEIGVMSYSFLMWHLSYSGHLSFELMMKFFLWFLKLMFWAIFVSNEFRFCSDHNETGFHVNLCLDVTFVIQQTHWLWNDNKFFSCDSWICVSVITNAIGVRSCSVLTCHTADTLASKWW